MRRLLPLLLIAACAATPPRAAVVDAGAAAIREVTLQVTNESRRPLVVPRRDLFEQIDRLRGRPDPLPSPLDALAAAAAVELAGRGIQIRADGEPAGAAFRIALQDLDIRDAATAGSTAFVSARYALIGAGGATLWETTQKRLPISLGGPDLTQSVLARIAASAVRQALSTFPVAPSP